MTKHRLMTQADADKFGFEWPLLTRSQKAARVQVTRTAEVGYESTGYDRHLMIATKTDRIEVRVTPGGRIHVYRPDALKRRHELKEVENDG